MKLSETVRRWSVRSLLLIVVLSAYGTFAGCTPKTYVEENGRGHDFHHEHDHDRY